MTEQDSTRGGRLKQAAKLVQGDIGHKVIVTIGIDEYEHMPRLHNAVSDALGIHEFFTDAQMGFESLPPLLDGEATKDAINALLEDRLPATVGKDDAVVLFFAGHGCSRTLGDEEVGYLVPVEARQEHWGDYVRIEDFLGRLDGIPARHVVVILDACRSGFALGRAMMQTRDSEAPRFARELLRRRSRHVLTSALADQDAYDGGPIGKHSLFTGFMIHGLRTGAADRDGNGVVMTRELSEYVVSSVASYSDGKQTPDFGTFSIRNDERGQLFFPSLGSLPAAQSSVTPPVLPKVPVSERRTFRERLPTWVRTPQVLGAAGVIVMTLLAALIANRPEITETLSTATITLAASPDAATTTAAAVVPDVTLTMSTTATATRTPTSTPIYADQFEPNDSVAEAYLTSSGLVLPLNTLWPPGDVDYFRFFAKRGLVYEVLTRDLDWGVDTFITLYDADGNVLEMNDDVVELSRASLINFSAPDDGFYFVGVENHDPNDPADQTYSLEIREVLGPPTPTPVASIDDCEPNDSFDSTCVIDLSTVYDFDFVPSSRTVADQDYFRFPVKQNLYYACETFNLSALNDTVMTLYSEPEEESTVNYNDDKDSEGGDLGSEAEYMATYTGWLYVLVEPVPGRVPEYDNSLRYTYSLECFQLLSTPTPTPAVEPTSESDQS